MFVCVFLFFKQKTAYEMRISDWSSDVCSSDLVEIVAVGVQCRRVRVGRPDDLSNTGYTRLRATGVVEEERVTHCHGPQEVACLVVANPVPSRLAKLFQPLDGQFVGLGFHQPMGHDFYSWAIMIKKVQRSYDKPRTEEGRVGKEVFSTWRT